MRHEFRFICGLRNGLHARPASVIAETVRRLAAGVTIGKGGGPGVDARSVLSVVGLDVRFGDECLVVAEGGDAALALAALRELIEHRLGEGEEVGSGGGEGPVAGAARLPVGLRKLGVAHAVGRMVCGGAGEGEAVVLESLVLCPELMGAKAGSVEKELGAARAAVDGVRDELRTRAERAHGIEGDLLWAHAEITGDLALWGEIEREVRAGKTAAQGVVGAAERFMQRLRGATSQYIRDRVIDVQDVAMQVVGRLAGTAEGGGFASAGARLERESVVFAETLTPSQFLRLDRRHLRGLVLGSVGATSHTAILARSHRVPTLVDVFNPLGIVRAGARVVVDAGGGFVVTDAGAEVVRYYARDRRARAKRTARLGAAAHREGRTSDGVRLELAVNAATSEEVDAGVAEGAEGVGLLRTELLFLERETAPSEEEQFEAYSAVVRAASGRPVIVRTFDIGGDKPARYIRIAAEENPFLGVRGVRLYAREETLLRTQLRAILRASALGPVRVMAPMVTTAAEAAWFRARVRGVQEELLREGVTFDESMPVGVMVEVPAAAMAMERIAEHVDFFSIGTNDLCQYWNAADRGNAGVAGLCHPLEPSFLRLLALIVEGAKRVGKWIGVCGEMAGESLHLPLMVGLGVDEISVSAGRLLALKSAIGVADSGKCRDVLERAMGCRDGGEVEALLRGAAWRGGAASAVRSILDPGMIDIGGDSQSKEEAIKDVVDLLHIGGRTELPREVEESVWAREETYSTGLGYGFAVPHCKCGFVDAPCLAVLKLAEAVEWGSMDGLPVDVVILLAVPSGGSGGSGGDSAAAEHMKTFAKLARKLMHESFRDRLRAAGTPADIHACLREELGIE